jgi:hypothetical protein
VRRRHSFGTIKKVPKRDDLRAAIDGRVDEVVSNAVEFQAFARTFVPPRTKAPLLVERDMWLLPVADRSGLSDIVKPLHQEDHDALVRILRQQRTTSARVRAAPQ